MGEARRRGAREQRIAQAQARMTDEAPINVPCRTCNGVLNGFTLLEHHTEGAVWQKTCPDCGAVTTALVQARHSTLPRTFSASLKVKEAIVGSGHEKVSVSFLEKNLDTVETGLVRL